MYLLYCYSWISAFISVAHTALPFAVALHLCLCLLLLLCVFCVFGVLVAFVAPVPSPCVIYSSPAAFATASSATSSSSLSSSSSWWPSLLLLLPLLLLLCSHRSVLCFISCWRQPGKRNLTLCSLWLWPQHFQGLLCCCCCCRAQSAAFRLRRRRCPSAAVAFRPHILWVVKDAKWHKLDFIAYFA